MQIARLAKLGIRARLLEKQKACGGAGAAPTSSSCSKINSV